MLFESEILYWPIIEYNQIINISHYKYIIFDVSLYNLISTVSIMFFKNVRNRSPLQGLHLHNSNKKFSPVTSLRHR